MADNSVWVRSYWVFGWVVTVLNTTYRTVLKPLFENTEFNFWVLLTTFGVSLLFFYLGGRFLKYAFGVKKITPGHKLSKSDVLDLYWRFSWIIILVASVYYGVIQQVLNSKGFDLVLPVYIFAIGLIVAAAISYFIKRMQKPETYS